MIRMKIYDYVTSGGKNLIKGKAEKQELQKAINRGKEAGLI